jgi:phosphate transport system protein
MLMQTLELEVQRLQNELLDLGGMVEHAVLESVETLKRRDLSAAQRLIALDRSIKKKRFAIEMDCLTLIITQGPVEGQLRAVTSMLEIATELERTGEYIREIVSMPFVIIDGPLQGTLPDIHTMAMKTQGMLHRAMRAFIGGDVALARTVPAEDAEVDALYVRVYGELLEFMRNHSHKKSNTRALVNQTRYLAHISRDLERIGDQVAGICGWTVYSVSGEIVEIDSSGPWVSAAFRTQPGAVAERTQEEMLPG